MRALIQVLPVGFFSVCVTVLSASTIRVPADQPTIQAGIDAAIDGDTVLVADGTYTGDGNRDIDFLGKALVVKSENGPESTIIDCEGSAQNKTRGFTFHSGEDSTSIVQGFTIMNGWVGAAGGGIYCENASPVIRGNHILDNDVGRDSFLGFGGGIYCSEASPIIAGNTIGGNWALLTGGGISCYYSASRISNNTIYENNTSLGAGIYAWESELTISGNTISVNSTLPHGTNQGGGVFCEESSSLLITNTILWDNSSEEGEEIYICDVSGNPSTVSIGYSDVRGGQDYVVVDSGCVLLWEEGMITADPLFVDSPAEDYGLLTDSPCIDAGDPLSVVPPRGGDRIDVGALEYQYPVFSFLTLIFENTPSIAVPGEELVWDFTVASSCTEYVVFDGWIAVSGPKSVIMDSILNVILPPGADRLGQVTLSVPDCTPPGLYTAKGRVGIMHEAIWDGEVFDGEIAGRDRYVAEGFRGDEWKVRIDMTRSNR